MKGTKPYSQLDTPQLAITNWGDNYVQEKSNLSNYNSPPRIRLWLANVTRDIPNPLKRDLRALADTWIAQGLLRGDISEKLCEEFPQYQPNPDKRVCFKDLLK